jgi:hypothetical protein
VFVSDEKLEINIKHKNDKAIDTTKTGPINGFKNMDKNFLNMFIYSSK